MQLTSNGITPEVIRKGIARLTQGVELGAALGDESVFFLVFHGVIPVSARIPSLPRSGETPATGGGKNISFTIRSSDWPR
jgi:hypothetical protein